MKKVKLGFTDLQVSDLCLGCLYFGARDSESDSFERLDQYLDAGGNFLDTANIYSHWINEKTKGGESEELLGRWLKKRGNRNQVLIASKMGFAYPGVEQGLSEKQILAECDKSLKRLGVDTIDLYYAHTDDLATDMAETLGAFQKLIDDGKIRAIGASNFRAWRLEQAWQLADRHQMTKYCCIQQRYSYLRPKSGWDFQPQLAANDDLLEYVQHRPISLLAYSPLLNGAYVDKRKSFQPQYIGPDSEARLKALADVCQDTGYKANQIVYAWLMQTTPQAIPLVASSTREQLDEAIAASEIILSATHLKILDEARDSASFLLHAF